MEFLFNGRITLLKDFWPEDKGKNRISGIMDEAMVLRLEGVEVGQLGSPLIACSVLA